MGKKTVLGVDLGNDRLKLALMKDGRVKKAVNIPMPENMMRDGRVTSPDAMADLIRAAVKQNHLWATRAALVLPDEPLYLRTLFMPPMNEEQLRYNLPYEFNDYITGELKDYVFDYAVVHLPQEESEKEKEKEQENHENNENNNASESEVNQEGEETAQTSDAVSVDFGAPSEALGSDEPDPRHSMELLAVAAPTDMIESARDIMRKAGLRLIRAAPVECAFIALIRSLEYGRTPKPKEYCFLDLGYRSIRMYMFKGVRHMATRALDVGLFTLDQAIAEAFHVDVHLAHTYLLSNYEDCQNSDYCRQAYNNVAVELTRALNFFKFSHPESHLSGMWVFGGGAVIEPLRKAISSNLDLKVHRIIGMIPSSETIGNDAYSFAPAVGITEAFEGADKSFIKKRRDLPFKVSINLSAVNEKRINPMAAIPAIALILIGAALFGKFAVYDQLEKAAQARREVAQVKAQLEAGYAQVEEYGELNDVYAHYTTSGMTEEELTRTDRVAVMELLRRAVLPRTPLDSWSLSGNRLSLTISGATLEAVNQTVSAIREEPLVDYCNVSAAATGDGNVTANITIDLKPNSEEDQEQNGLSQS